MISRIVPGRTAFFVCDVQERFRTVIHSYSSIIATSEKMIKAAQILSIPIICTEQSPEKLGLTCSELALSDLPKSLYTGPIAKTRFSMVLPEVISQLKAWETQSVVIFGIESHVCVMQTSLDLLYLGYQVTILADGVSSCNSAEVKIALDRLRQAGALVESSESVLFQLMVDATHPNFRAVSGLIKASKDATKSSLDNLTLIGKL